MTQEQDEDFDHLYQRLKEKQPNMSLLLDYAKRTPVCVQYNITCWLRLMWLISSILVCCSSYVYSQVFNTFPHNYELTPSSQIALVYVNAQAQ